MVWTKDLTPSHLLVTFVVLANTYCIQCRTTKSRSGKTSTTRDRSFTTTAKLPSLLDMPQNDIYNNRVDEQIDLLNVPTLSPLRRDSYTPDEQSKITWNLLNANNAKKPPKYNRPGERTVMRGPPGPQGPPGAEVTKDDMVKEFKKMVKQAAEKRARKIIKAKCPTCDVSDLDGDMLSNYFPGVQDKVRTVNRSPTAFTTKLQKEVIISPSLTSDGQATQIKKFQLTGEQHGSIRGVAADYGMDGRFRVDKDGIYQFTTTLNIHSGHRVDYARESPNNFVEVRLYSNSKSGVQSLLAQFVHSMDSRQRYFTVQLTSMPQLKVGNRLITSRLNILPSHMRKPTYKWKMIP